MYHPWQQKRHDFKHPLRTAAGDGRCAVTGNVGLVMMWQQSENHVWSFRLPSHRWAAGMAEHNSNQEGCYVTGESQVLEPSIYILLFATFFRLMDNLMKLTCVVSAQDCLHSFTFDTGSYVLIHHYSIFWFQDRSFLWESHYLTMFSIFIYL